MSSSSTLSLDHLPPSEQLCYVHCNNCDTVLAVSISLPYFFCIPPPTTPLTLFLYPIGLGFFFLLLSHIIFTLLGFPLCLFYDMSIGERSLHQSVQDCYRSMWTLRQPLAWIASTFCQSASPRPRLLLFFPQSSGIS